MKKSSLIPHLQRKLGSSHSARKQISPADGLYIPPSSRGDRRKIYRAPKEASPTALIPPPQLSIRGSGGGSVGIDLRGIGIGLSQTAFGHWVDDESLRMMHIHRGDLAIVDCTDHVLQEGNLILLDLNGRSVLRRLRKRHRIWYLETSDGCQQSSLPLTNQPLHGVVISVIRLFSKAKPVQNGTTGGVKRSLATGKQPRGSRVASYVRDRKGVSKRRTVPSSPSVHRTAVALAAEEAATYRPAPPKKGR